MKKVWIDPGCITCGSCEFLASEIFEVTDLARVKKDANLSGNKDLIELAARACPVNVIKYEKIGE